MKIAAVTLLFAATTTQAFAQGAAPVQSTGLLSTFTEAGIVPKIIMLALVALIIAAAAICVRKVMSGPKLSGGSHFLSSLRAGGPLLGLVGAVLGFINNAQAISVLGPQPLQVMMPGVVENLSLIMLGLLAGVVAVIGHWVVEARIDREVLRA